MTTRSVLSALVLGGLVCAGSISAAHGQSRWPAPRKEPIEVRLIAVEIAYPRTSFFANDEVLIAEQELAKNESRFVRLIYDFLPYQNPLSSFGLSYSLVHRVQAIRDTTCDETLWQVREFQRKSGAPSTQFKYAADSPIADLERRQARLRCFRVTSDDYENASHRPTNEVPY
ncbi:MAG TPA: hypothetical protein VJS37_05015 [Terriglobales bacterium]|nr:hypothetical protein [Terriglobales bacterium]